MKKLHPDSEIIDRMDGTTVVARLCKVRPPSVTKWRYTGIPKARRMYLELIRPDVFTPELAKQEPEHA